MRLLMGSFIIAPSSRRGQRRGLQLPGLIKAASTAESQTPKAAGGTACHS
jgi:hypothetical protein